MRADKCPVEVSMIKDEKTEENARSQSTMNWEEEHINQSEKQMQQEKQEAREWESFKKQRCKGYKIKEKASGLVKAMTDNLDK